MAPNDVQLPAPGKNQGSDLWDTPLGTIPNIEKLTGRQNYNTWRDLVITTLKPYNIECLIVSRIPRPEEGSTGYENWRVKSCHIKEWLSFQISSEVAREIRSTGNTYKYGDEMMDAIKRAVFGGESITWLSAWMGTVFLKRSDYATVDQFVTTFRDKVEHCRDIQMPISAFQATGILLRGVEQELSEFTCATWKELAAKDNRGMEMAEFYELCDEVKNIAMLKEKA